MTTRLSSWALAGALMASMTMNVAQWGGAPADSAAANPSHVEAMPNLDTLGLTDDQITRIQSCCVDQCAERQDLEESIAQIEEALRDSLGRDRVDPERARALADQLGTLRARCILNGVESILQVREILDRVQVDALIECFEQCCGTVLRDR